MDVRIREEMVEDRRAVAEVVEAAFESVEYSDHREHLLVERLRGSNAFIPQLSLVADVAGAIVGHVLLTRAEIQGARPDVSLALAPLSVAPGYQRRGIGSQLVVEAHRRARLLGFEAIVVLGHAGYYPRFGYRPAKTLGIVMPFDVPDQNCMVVDLTDKGLSGMSGKVVYPPEFQL